jgi:hypothetical protein
LRPPGAAASEEFRPALATNPLIPQTSRPRTVCRFEFCLFSYSPSFSRAMRFSIGYALLALHPGSTQRAWCYIVTRRIERAESEQNQASEHELGGGGSLMKAVPGHRHLTLVQRAMPFQAASRSVKPTIGMNSGVYKCGGGQSVGGSCPWQNMPGASCSTWRQIDRNPRICAKRIQINRTNSIRSIT